MSIFGPVKNPSSILVINYINNYPINEMVIDSIYFPKIALNICNIVNETPILNVMSKTLANNGKYIYLVVTTLDISCRYLKFLFSSYFDILGF